MFNINKNTFFLGLLVVASLLLLGSCGSGSSGKKETPKPTQTLEEEKQQLIDEISKKLNLTGEQKAKFEKEIQEIQIEAGAEDNIKTIMQGFEDDMNQLDDDMQKRDNRLVGYGLNLKQLNQLVNQLPPDQKEQIESELLPIINKRLQNMVYGSNITHVEDVMPTIDLILQLLRNVEKQIDLGNKPKK